MSIDDSFARDPIVDGFPKGYLERIDKAVTDFKAKHPDTSLTDEELFESALRASVRAENLQ